jgi:hypothetical protein
MCSPTTAARLVRSIVGCFVIIAAPATLHAANFGPTPYTSTADSPFNSAGLNGYFFIENFETGGASQPGLNTLGNTVLGPGANTDSVDADDGAIDGSGTGGHSLQVNNLSQGFGSFQDQYRFVVASFAVPGGAPTHAGVVWTDSTWPSPAINYPLTLYVLGTPGSGVGNFIDDDGNGVTDEPSERIRVDGPTFNARGDSLTTGATAEDRFVGISLDGGISQIGFSAQILAGSPPTLEVDHVQYGTIPEPSAVGTAGVLLFGCAMRRRRR